ncbi:MAG TPA: uracil-DNA glycosylase [Actinomycetota bacterium]|nr:uracil-DNA glycosylase [Actinomycetota bacterium]
MPGRAEDAAGVAIDALRDEALVCTKCRLAAGRTNVVWAAGNLDADLLLIGEAPGFHEDRQGIPFVGAAGTLLDQMLAEVGLDRSRAAIVNVIKCRPPGNRDPQPDEIEACRPYLEAQLAHMQPRVIITLGNFATRFILEDQIGITRARGRVYRRRGAAVVPTFHPAAALRGGRFGGMSPVDAIRLDFKTARTLLERAAAPRPEPAPAPARVSPSGARAGNGQQLGLF